MYPWVTHTWNPIRGRCPHECSYCYMKGLVHGEPRFIESELKINLGPDRRIFVGSSIDLFADAILQKFNSPMSEILRKCRNNPTNQYLFQSKNPKGMWEFYQALPDDSILGTTLESNRDYSSMSLAPDIEDRVGWMEHFWHLGFTGMISIEPILDFDLKEFIELVKWCAPLFVSIGADSKGHHLPEPSAEKVLDLIEALKEITEVKIKDNLERIIGPGRPQVSKIDRDGVI